MGFIVSILVGALAGYLAGRLMEGAGFGFLVNMLVGMVGGFLGGNVLGWIGIDWGRHVYRHACYGCYRLLPAAVDYLAD